MKDVRIFLLVLIIIGIGLIFTQSIWVPKVDNAVLQTSNISSQQTAKYITGSDVATIATAAIRGTSPWTTYHVDQRLPGSAAFDVNYPSVFGEPTITTTINKPSSVDFDSNIAQLVFYKEGAPHTYPQAGSEFYMTMNISISKLKPGQTIDDFAAAQIEPTDKNKLSYPVRVDGQRAIAEGINSAVPIWLYYVPLNTNTVMQILIGFPGPRGTQLQTNTLRVLMDKIVESIKFSK